MWHKIAPLLARDFTVVAADLRGYGDSTKPPTTDDHEPYSKRAMARDQIAVMHALGFEQFFVAGHDRGGRCAYRMALAGEMFRRTDMAFGMSYWHWFFLAQPFDLPERMIGANPDNYYLPNRNLFDPEALADYLRCVRDPETIHAMCEDYRAGATYDFALDEADFAAGRKIVCPLLALWGSRGPIATRYDFLGIWRDWADDVQGHAVDSGHYLAEEAPDETYAALHTFFTA
jgi:haloacetate dehalogenase